MEERSQVLVLRVKGKKELFLWSHILFDNARLILVIKLVL